MINMSIPMNRNGEITVPTLRQLEALYSPKSSDAESTEFFGRSIRPWNARGSGICKYVKSLFKIIAKFTSSNKQTGTAQVEIFKKTEKNLGYAGYIFGSVELTLLTTELISIRANIESIRNQLDRPSSSAQATKLEKELRALEQRRAKILREIAIGSAFVGLGVSNVAAETLASHGARAAGAVSKILGGVGALLVLALEVRKIKKLVNARVQVRAKAEKVDTFFKKMLPTLNSQTERSGKILLSAYKNRVKKLQSNSRYNFFMAGVGLMQAVLASVSQAVMITGLFVAFSAAVALTPLNNVALALLGLSLICLAVRCVYTNQETWMLNIQQMFANWKEESLTKEKSKVETSLDKLRQRVHKSNRSNQKTPLLATQKQEAKDERAQEKLEEKHKKIVRKIDQLNHRQHQLQCSQVQASYRKVFQGPSDLETIRHLSDAILELRTTSEGRDFMGGLFEVLGEQLPDLSPRTYVTPHELLDGLRNLPASNSTSQIYEIARLVNSFDESQALKYLSLQSSTIKNMLNEELTNIIEPENERKLLRAVKKLLISV